MKFKKFSKAFLSFLFLLSFTVTYGMPGGCTPAATVACGTPSVTCTDPVFNAGTGGSIDCGLPSPVAMPGCQSCISGTTVNSEDLTTTTYSCGDVDGIVWFTMVVPDANNTFTVTPGTLLDPIVVIDDGDCTDMGILTFLQRQEVILLLLTGVCLQEV